MNFMFLWQKQYLTSEHSERVRYSSCQSNIKFISSSHPVISSMYCVTYVETIFIWWHQVLKDPKLEPLNLKFFTLIRHKRCATFICEQFFSSIASLVWEQAHFEFHSYDSAWHKVTIAIKKNLSRDFFHTGKEFI